VTLFQETPSPRSKLLDSTVRYHPTDISIYISQSLQCSSSSEKAWKGNVPSRLPEFGSAGMAIPVLPGQIAELEKVERRSEHC
jgi:hypothetical protein